MSRDEEVLERVKAQLESWSVSLPELIERVRAAAEARNYTLQTPLPEAEKVRERLASLAAYLDHYGRVDPGTLGSIDVRDVLEQAVGLTRAEIEVNARVGTSYLAAPLVRANSRQLGHVFVSLLVNAAQAVPPGAPDAHYVEIELDTNEAGWARVAIADSGVGISADLLPYIFEPLYSTKRGATTGVGLAIARAIVHGFGGRIRVESVEGSGTLVILELPPAP